jgi:hypothetical protein
MNKILSLLSILVLLGCAAPTVKPPNNVTGTIYECPQLRCVEDILREKNELQHYIDTCGDPRVLGMQQGVVTALINRCRKLDESKRHAPCEEFEEQNKWLDDLFEKYGCENP